MYSEYFKLYNFREKNILSESGAYYDQPNLYIEVMLEMDSAMSDRTDVSERFTKDKSRIEDKKLDELRGLGLNITKKS